MRLGRPPLAMGTLTLRLAESLVVRSVTAPGLGRLLTLRVKGEQRDRQPAAGVVRDEALVLTVVYAAGWRTRPLSGSPGARPGTDVRDALGRALRAAARLHQSQLLVSAGAVDRLCHRDAAADDAGGPRVRRERYPGGGQPGPRRRLRAARSASCKSSWSIGRRATSPVVLRACGLTRPRRTTDAAPSLSSGAAATTANPRQMERAAGAQQAPGTGVPVRCREPASGGRHHPRGRSTPHIASCPSLALVDDPLPGGHSPAYFALLPPAAADHHVLVAQRPGEPSTIFRSSSSPTRSRTSTGATRWDGRTSTSNGSVRRLRSISRCCTRSARTGDRLQDVLRQLRRDRRRQSRGTVRCGSAIASDTCRVTVASSAPWSTTRERWSCTCCGGRSATRCSSADCGGSTRFALHGRWARTCAAGIRAESGHQLPRFFERWIQKKRWGRTCRPLGVGHAGRPHGRNGGAEGSRVSGRTVESAGGPGWCAAWSAPRDRRSNSGAAPRAVDATAAAGGAARVTPASARAAAVVVEGSSRPATPSSTSVMRCYEQTATGPPGLLACRSR